MRPFISILTATAVLLHMVLGCCWHRGHAECDLAGVNEHFAGDSEEEDDFGLVEDAHEHDLADADHDHQHPGEQHHHDHHKCHCDGGSCLAIHPRGIESRLNLFSSSVWTIAVSPTVQAVEACYSNGIFQSDQDLAPPIRRHLLLQVLRT